MDFLSIEVRHRNIPWINSEWIGEIQLNAKDFRDGSVHENWYRLGKGSWKFHRREPRGFIHLEIQLMDNKYSRPFVEDENRSRITFDQWRAGVRGRTISQATTSQSSLQAQQPSLLAIANTSPSILSAENNTAQVSASTILNNSSERSFELTYKSIAEAYRSITRNSLRILTEERATQKDILDMKKLNKVNCLHKGNFEQMTGRRYMVAVDGSESSKTALGIALKLVNPSTDHLFIATVREKIASGGEFDERNNVILTHKLWRAAAGIVSQAQQQIRDSNLAVEFTSIMPEAYDVREMVCALVKKYNIDVLVIGKHKENEQRHQLKFHQSFQRYCQSNVKCSIMTF